VTLFESPGFIRGEDVNERDDDQPAYRVLVTGSRKLPDDGTVLRALERLVKEHCWRRFVVVVGDCPTGADSYAARDAFTLGQDTVVEVHRADWKVHGRTAGPRRNLAMVQSGADICLAFFADGEANTGTKHCTCAARTGGIPVREHRY
jgi:hypothetical protein